MRSEVFASVAPAPPAAAAPPVAAPSAAAVLAAAPPVAAALAAAAGAGTFLQATNGFLFYFIFQGRSPRYYTHSSRTLSSTHAIGYLRKPD
jgi:hypothetical protein